MKQWWLQNEVTQNAMTKLLKGLKMWHPSLPLTSSTLLKTPKNVEILKIGSGEHHYFGLKNSIKKTLPTLELSHKCLNLSFNVDRVSLYKSNNKQFWPILCSVEEDPKQQPILIALFCRSSKPPIEDFLSAFIYDLKILQFNGLAYNHEFFEIKIKLFCCDAPAKAYLKGIKGHNGYYGCDRCCEKGVRLDHRTTFPERRKGTAEKRDNNSFRCQKQKEHHIFQSPSLELDIDMVKDFPHDAMHLIFLGVIRCMLYCCIGRGSSISDKISFQNRKLLSKRLIETSQCWPTEFNRKPRSLHETDYWKVTEFRSFLLYLGPCYLKDILNSQYYCHFMLLFLATHILSSKDHCLLLNGYAHELLKLFVQKSKNYMDLNFWFTTYILCCI